MGPQQHQLHDDEGAGIDDVRLPLQRLHQRDDQRPGVGVDDGGALDGVQFQRAAQCQRERQEQQVDQHGGPQRKEQPGAQFGGVLDLEGVEDDAGHDQVDQDHREHAAVRCVQQPGAHHSHAQQQDQKQFGDLLGQQQADRLSLIHI